MSYTEIFGFQGTSPGFAKSGAPLPDLAGIAHLGFLAPIMDIGIAASGFACTLACINASARMAYAMSHDGMGAAPLTRIHPTRHTPMAAILLVAVPMVVVPGALLLARQDPIAVLGWTGTLSTFGFMVAYGLVALAAPVFLRRVGQVSAKVIAVGAAGLISMVVVFYASWLPQTIPGGLFAPLEWPYNLLPYIFFAWTAIGLGWYLIVRVRTPHVAAAIGTRFDAH